MNGRPATAERPDYGIDGPNVIRNFFLIGAIGFVVWFTAALGLWSGQVYGILVADLGLVCTMFCLLATGAMLWSSKIGKLRAREQLLDQLAWRGDETVLDVGCGRGLLLLGAAKRLTSGKAVGIDIWQAKDLSANRPLAVLENARREGVAERVEVKTADVRQLPFPDDSFDLVVSRYTLHNLATAPDRAQAIREIARVLKPDGQALINDIQYLSDYVQTFTQHGCRQVRRFSLRWEQLLWVLIAWGAVRPATVLVRKMGRPSV